MSLSMFNAGLTSHNNLYPYSTILLLVCTALELRCPVSPSPINHRLYNSCVTYLCHHHYNTLSLESVRNELLLTLDIMRGGYNEGMAISIIFKFHFNFVTKKCHTLLPNIFLLYMCVHVCMSVCTPQPPPQSSQKRSLWIPWTFRNLLDILNL